MNNFPSNDSLPCKYKVGFLVKRVCGRSSRVGCQYCKGQPFPPGTNFNNPTYDPYYYDRQLYYHDYYYGNQFTDSDARGLSVEDDTDFESSIDAS